MTESVTTATAVAHDPLLLPRARPSSVGVDASGVLDLLDALDERSLELHSLMVVRHGQVAAEGWWAPYSADRAHLLYSLSKSFTSTAVGFCVDEGRFALDDTVVSLLPEHAPDEVAESVAALTVHHLLSMSTGHSEDTLWRMRDLDPDDAVRGFLRLPPEEGVGSRHIYNNGTTYVLAAIVEKACGMPLLDYLRPRLLDPLGITAASWQTDERGQAMGFSGFHLQTESIAAFGQLLLQDGEWHGQRVLPEGWVELATRRHIGNDYPEDDGTPRNVDWRQGYGYQYWMSQHGFRGDGALGQFCVVVPDLDLVVATTAYTPDMQAVLDAIWAHLLPAMGEPGAATAEAGAVALVEDQLVTRLESLALPVLAALVDPPAEARTFVVEDTTDESPFAAGSRVTVAPDGDNALVTIELATTTLTFGCGRESWLEGSLGESAATLPGRRPVVPNEPVPVVCRGGWTATGAFEADLVLIETPHRIRMQAGGSRCVATWNTPSLTGSSIESQLPRS